MVAGGLAQRRAKGGGAPARRRSTDGTRCGLLAHVPDQQPRRRHLYRHALRGSVRDNASAFGYSLAITVSYGVCSHGSAAAGIPRDLLFLVGACLAFLLVVGVASKGLRKRVEAAPDNVALVASALNVVAVLGAACTAALATLLPGAVSWFAAGFGATLAYLLLGAVDVLLAREVTAGTQQDADG